MLNVDETGWRTNGDKRYLWAFVAWRFAGDTVASRGSEVLVRLQERHSAGCCAATVLART